MIDSLGDRTVSSRIIIDFRASARRPLELKARRCPFTPPLPVADCSVCHDSVRFARSGARDLRRKLGRSVAFLLRLTGQGNTAVAELRSFRVYRHKSVVDYHEGMARHSCDSLSGARAAALRTVPANEERSRRDETTSRAKERSE